MLQAGIFNPTDFTYKWTLVPENNFKKRRATWFQKFSPTCPYVVVQQWKLLDVIERALPKRIFSVKGNAYRNQKII